MPQTVDWVALRDGRQFTRVATFWLSSDRKCYLETECLRI